MYSIDFLCIQLDKQLMRSKLSPCEPVALLVAVFFFNVQLYKKKKVQLSPQVLSFVSRCPLRHSLYCPLSFYTIVSRRAHACKHLERSAG